MLLLLSCQSLPVEVEPIPIEIEWPVVPDPTGEVIMPKEGTAIIADGTMLIMSLDYWILIAEYVVDVERVRQTYEALK